MNFLDTHPDFFHMPDKEIIEKIPPNTLMAIFPDVVEYYNSKIRMGGVYALYGHELFDEGDQQQVPCLLPSHGTSDRHPSSRFYAVDRNTGEMKHGVYCFKCQKTVTPFWLLYFRESEQQGIKSRELFQYIQKIFKIPFPRNILFNFDAEQYYVFTTSEANSKMQKIQQANLLLQLKEARDPIYLSELKRLFMEG